MKHNIQCVKWTDDYCLSYYHSYLNMGVAKPNQILFSVTLTDQVVSWQF